MLTQTQPTAKFKGIQPTFKVSWQRWPHTRYRGDVRARSNERAKIAFSYWLRRHCGLEVKPEHIIALQIALEPLDVELAVSRMAGYEYPAKLQDAACHWPEDVEEPTSVTLSFAIISGDVANADQTLETFCAHFEGITGWQITDLSYSSRHQAVQWVQALAERPEEARS